MDRVTALHCKGPGLIRAVGDNFLSISCNGLGFRVTVKVSDRVLVQSINLLCHFLLIHLNTCFHLLYRSSVTVVK